MILYQYNTKVEWMNPDGAYFLSDDMQFASYLLNSQMFSTEVNIINKLKSEFKDIASDKIFVDIGASFGTYTLILGQIFKHTYAFEPDIHTYNILCGNIAMYNLSNKTTLINAPVSNKIETVNYVKIDTLGGNNYCFIENDNIAKLYPNYTPQSILSKQTVSLDSLNLSNIGLIKIDVEGFELRVLKGCVRSLESSNWPPFLIESWQTQETDSEEAKIEKQKLRKDLFNFIINELKYKITQISEDTFYCTKIKTVD